MTLDSFTSKEITSITPKSKPRLSQIEIEQLIEEYHFELPTEIYDLYQRGNGSGLPIGLNRNYDFYTNYFPFPDPDLVWYDLEKAMNMYKQIKNYEELDNRLFPLFSSELKLYVVMGNKEKRSTSCIFSISHDDSLSVPPRLASSSLTNLMLACAERMEKGHNNVSVEYLMNKYEVYDDNLMQLIHCYKY